MSVFFIPLILYFFCAFSLKKIIVLFRKTSLIDKPTERSNHTSPTPKGAGIIVIPFIIFSSILVFFLNEILDVKWIVFFVSCFILMIISFIDDLYNLPSTLRLIVHFCCVSLSLFYLKEEILEYSQNLEFFKILGLGPEIDFFIVTLFLIFFWLWIINLFNFMDGMDGITSIQVIFLALTTNTLSLIGYLNQNFQLLSVLILAAFLAFYNFNKPPARIFLGDVGSISIGYLCGLIIIYGMLSFNVFVPLCIIVMYYLVDSTLTLLLRLIRGENIFKAHSDHFYQRILRSGQSHNQVLLKFIALSFLLFIFSILSTQFFLLSLSLAFTSTVGLIIYFWKKGKNE